MENQRLDELLEKYILKTATVEEQHELLDWYIDQNDGDVIWTSDQLNEDVLVKKRLLQNINARTQSGLKTIKLWSRIAVAAAAVAAITLGVWFYTARQSRLEVGNPGRAQYATDIAPGKNGATITLANGKVIKLSDAKSGVVIGNGLKYSDGAEILKQIQDDGERGGRSEALTASTAKGQTYQFTLPDGTKVWLNADSELEFPSSFANNRTRNVKLSGEGYFEVAKDKVHPFIVKTEGNMGPGQEVKVLGTQFNINAYADEPAIATTLLEGSVKLTVGNSEKMLKPGEQAISDDGKIKVGKASMDAIVDWKNEEFFLDKMDFRVAMRKIARWYNIEVIYNGSVPANLEAGGWIPRNSKLSDVLKSIESTGQVKFKIEGKKLYVSK